MSFNLIDYLNNQIVFSVRTFGPHNNVESLLDHISKECEEIRENPQDLEEWIDIMILAFDGALRQGHSPDSLVKMLEHKLEKNKNRTWPDWRTVDKTKAIEHIKE